MNKNILGLVFSLLLGTSAIAEDSNNQLIKAIQTVESSNKRGKIVGDGGAAIGPLQIHYGNWKDAVEYNKEIGGTYLDCYKLEYSKKIFLAYINKYAKNGSAEKKARIWNGGPAGASKPKTKDYWSKVKLNLK
jgi:hypothetical protein